VPAALEQRRREFAHRDVVESVAGLVGWQQRRHVDVDREQVADGIAVLGARESPDRRRASGTRMSRRGAVE